jgi:Lrp/AsnC family leucine-responsive transcriptional regulator
MLMEDARRSVVEIARELEMPRSTVQERIRRMVETGLIRGFTAVPDYALLGRPVTAFILVSFMPGTVSQRELAEEIAKIPGVHEVHLISGEWDILLKVRAESMEAVGRLVIDRLRAMKGVARTVTCACFSTIKDEP